MSPFRVAVPGGRRSARHRLARLATGGVPAHRFGRLGRLVAVAQGRPLLAAGAGAVVGVAVGYTLAGPVAALLGGVYAGLAVRSGLRAAAERVAAAARAAAVDAVGALAADLRAGLAASAALADALPALVPGAGRPEPTVRHAGRLVDTAWEVGERLGAPLADLLDRIDGELRTAERCRSDAAAQTAGARATGWLLAALPGAGIALGYGIGGDPLRVLLHTPLGAMCAVGALLLQCAGLAWTARLCRGVVDEGRA